MRRIPESLRLARLALVSRNQIIVHLKGEKDLNQRCVWSVSLL